MNKPVKKSYASVIFHLLGSSSMLTGEEFSTVLNILIPRC
jgi:hypothetical protein